MKNNLHDSLGGSTVPQEFTGVSDQSSKQTYLGLETDDMVTEGVDPQTLMFIPNQAFDELDVEWMADAHEHFKTYDND